MKKYCFAIFFILTSFVLRAESYIGARYGAGMSLVYFIPYRDVQPLYTPINAAIAYRYCNDKAQDYERYMNFQIEFGYAQRGYTCLGGPGFPGLDSVTGMITRKSQVLELPLMLQARIPVVKHLNFLVTGIFYGAYYLNNTQTYDYKGTQISESFSYNHLYGFEYGVGGGLGVCIDIGKTDIILDARYTAGMSYLYKPEVEVYESMPMQIIVSLSIMRRIGK